MPAFGTTRTLGDGYAEKSSPAKLIKSSVVYEGAITSAVTVNKEIALTQGSSNLKLMVGVTAATATAADSISITLKRDDYSIYTASMTLPILAGGKAKILNLALPEYMIENATSITLGCSITSTATATSAMKIELLEYPAMEGVSQAYNMNPQNIYDVTPSNDADLPRAGVLYAGGQGNVVVDLVGEGTQKTLYDVYLFNTPVVVKKVYSTNTTATNVKIAW